LCHYSNVSHKGEYTGEYESKLHSQHKQYRTKDLRLMEQTKGTNELIKERSVNSMNQPKEHTHTDDDDDFLC